MRRVVWFIPFPDGSFRGDVATYLSGVGKRDHEDPRKVYEAISWSPSKSEQLRNLPKLTRLYVIGHGDANKNYLVADREAPGASPHFSHVGGKLALDPQQLADLLLHAGLPQIAEIRLWACIAARGSDIRETYAGKFVAAASVYWPLTKMFAYTDYLVLSSKGRKRGQMVTDEIAKGNFPSREARKSMIDVRAAIQAADAQVPDLDDDEDEPNWVVPATWNYPA